MSLLNKIVGLSKQLPGYTQIKFARYTTGNDYLILGTEVGQFTFDIRDCDFSGTGETIKFLFSRKNENNNCENFDLTIDNSGDNQKKNAEIIEEFRQFKSQRIARGS